jgi:hypothetical protein
MVRRAHHERLMAVLWFDKLTTNGAVEGFMVRQAHHERLMVVSWFDKLTTNGVTVLPIANRKHALTMVRFRIVGGLLAFKQAVIARYIGDPQSIVGKNFVATCALCGAMRRLIAPRFHCIFIAPKRE